MDDGANFMNALKALLKFPLRTALKSRRLRGILSYELQQVEEFELQVPLSHGFSCPLVGRDSVYSFSEIFLAEEYGDFLSHIPMPTRWIDFGCHAGYFSLFLAWQAMARNGARESRACLIDADPRVSPAIHRLFAINAIENQWMHLNGAIADPAQGTCSFHVRSVMASSCAEGSEGATLVTVPVLAPSLIVEKFAPPYDLIKVDIEGAELALIQFYGDVLRQSRHIIIEWHQWDGQDAREKIDIGLVALGFQRIQVLRESRPTTMNSKTLHAGTDLYVNKAAKGR